MDFRFLSTKDKAEGQLDSGIGASALTIPLVAGHGARFPATYSGTATSAGTATILNVTGIGSSGILIGDFIRNATDGSHAFVLAITTDSVTTTELKGGIDNLWQSGDEYVVNSFVVTLNRRDVDGNITDDEKVLVKTRSGDSLLVETGGRGYDGTTPQSWSTGEYVDLFVESSLPRIAIQKALAELHEELDKKASITYVDGSIGAQNWKEKVIVATTSAGTLASSFEAGDTVDGYVLLLGDRILIKDQVNLAENGVYIVNASGAPTRATDFDESAEVTSAVVPVQQGAVNADTIWICTANNPVIGVNNLTFQQLGGSSIWSPGDVKSSFRTSPEAGWFLLDNSEKNMTTYEALLLAIGFAGGLGTNVSTFTVTPATDVINKVGHGLSAGTIISVSNTGGGLPGGLATNTVYYVKNPTANSFEVSLTNGGATVDITSNGTGTHSYQTAFKIPEGRGRVLAGKDAGTFNVLGKLNGSETKNLQHLHTLSASGTALIGESIAFGGAVVGWKSTGASFIGNKHGTAPGGAINTVNGNIANRTELSGTTDNAMSTVQDVLNPSVVVNFFIKY